MKFQIVCNPVFTVKKCAKIFRTIKKKDGVSKKTLVLSGNLFMNGVENNVDLWGVVSEWASRNYKAVLVVPGYKDLFYDYRNVSDPNPKFSGLSDDELYNMRVNSLRSDYKNVMVSVDDSIVSDNVCVMGGVFESKDDERFLENLSSISDKAREMNVPLLVVSYNVFKLDRTTKDSVRFHTWVYSNKKVKSLSKKFVTNNCYDEDFNPSFVVEIKKDVKPVENDDLEPVGYKDNIKKLAGNMFSGNDDMDNEYLYRMCKLYDNRHTYNEPITFD